MSSTRELPSRVKLARDLATTLLPDFKSAVAHREATHDRVLEALSRVEVRLTLMQHAEDEDAMHAAAESLHDAITEARGCLVDDAQQSLSVLRMMVGG